MKVKDFTKLIYNPKTATYHMTRRGIREVVHYQRLMKNYWNDEIRFIENFSPDKYCFNHWWIFI